MEGASQLVGTVGQLLGEEYRLLSRVGGEVVELRHDLATMNAILRMQSEAEDGLRRRGQRRPLQAPHQVEAPRRRPLLARSPSRDTPPSPSPLLRDQGPPCPRHRHQRPTRALRRRAPPLAFSPPAEYYSSGSDDGGGFRRTICA